MVRPSQPYPRWSYFPRNRRPDDWALQLVSVVASARDAIDSATAVGLSSSSVLASLRPGLEALGYTVEAGKLAADLIRRPVLFGSEGQWVVEYNVDAVHDELRIVLEIEAGRGARSNAVYRDLIRSALIVDVQFLALGVMHVFRYRSGARTVEVPSFDDALRQIDAIYASGRLDMPFKGLLLFGY